MIEIRPARPEEHERIGELTLAAYAGYESHFRDPSRWPDYANRLRDPAARQDVVEHLVALDDGAVAGAVTLVATEDEPGVLWFRYLATDPGAARRGVGRRLVEACVEEARARGYEQLGWKTIDYMESGRALYRAMGFGEGTREEVRPGVELIVYRIDVR